MSLYVGVDSGTQSVKAVALDMETGRVVAEARAQHHLIAGLPAGHMEQHPEEWAAAMDAAIGEVASQDRPLAGARHRRIGPAARVRARWTRRAGSSAPRSSGATRAPTPSARS